MNFLCDWSHLNFRHQNFHFHLSNTAVAVALFVAVAVVAAVVVSVVATVARNLQA